jgi:two-component system phosphate regulon sensor histidine kinase PhoR
VREHYFRTRTGQLKNIIGLIEYDAIDAIMHSLALRNAFPKDLLVEYESIAAVRARTKHFFERYRSGDEETHIRLTLIDLNGVVLADTEMDPKVMDNHLHRPEIIDANFSGEFGFSIRYSDSVRSDMLYAAKKIESGGKPIGYLRASIFLHDLNLLLEELLFSILSIGALLMFLYLAIALLITRNITRPIRDLVQAAGRVSSGDFEVSLNVVGQDEIANLSRSFASMVARIHDLFKGISEKKEELRRILESIGDGILLLDPGGRIVTGNQSVADIFQNRNIAIGAHYRSIIDDERIIRFIEDSFLEEQNGLEISRLNRIYRCRAVRIPVPGEVLIVFHDITEFKNLEQIKKDLIANVSHELRTPLTAIKGFIETLYDEYPGTARGYLQIIERHTDRLTSIVQDLLILSSLEDDHVKMKRERVNLSELSRDIVAVFIKKAAQKQLELHLELQSNEISLERADRYRLEQLLINMIDNAIKYTEKGSVTVRIGRDDGHAKIEVEDTGIGIPGEHLPRLYERFYVVDKSRSRSSGGTGLGLSIVKHIVQLHGGSIDVKSVPGRGTLFTVLLPIG